MLASMLGFMKKAKRIRNTELDGSIYLSQLDADELDPEIARLYLPHCRCMESYKPEGTINPINSGLMYNKKRGGVGKCCVREMAECL